MPGFGITGCSYGGRSRPKAGPSATLAPPGARNAGRLSRSLLECGKVGDSSWSPPCVFGSHLSSSLRVFPGRISTPMSPAKGARTAFGSGTPTGRHSAAMWILRPESDDSLVFEDLRLVACQVPAESEALSFHGGRGSVCAGSKTTRLAGGVCTRIEQDLLRRRPLCFVGCRY